MATYRLCAIRDVDAWDAMSAGEQAVYDAHYTSIADFVTNECNVDLVTTGLGNLVAEVYNDWPGGMVGNVFFDNSTLVADSSNKIIIKAADGHATAGVPGTGAAIKFSTDVYYGLRNKYDVLLEIEGLEFLSDLGTTYSALYQISDTVFRGCIFYNLYTLVALDAAGSTFIDCLFLPWQNGYITGGKVYNCTFFQTADTTRALRSAECYNTVIYSAVSLTFGCFYDCTGDYNASSDDTAPGIHTTAAHRNLTLADLKFIEDAPVDGVAYNLHTAEDSALVDTGTPFDDTFVITIADYTDDIIGVSRTNGTAWDIGAFEYEVGGQQGVPVTVELRSVIEGSNCFVEKQADGTVVIGPVLADVTGVVSGIHDYLEDVPVYVKVRKSSVGDSPRYLPYKASGVITESGLVDYVDQTEDSVLNG